MDLPVPFGSDGVRPIVLGSFQMPANLFPDLFRRNQVNYTALLGDQGILLGAVIDPDKALNNSRRNCQLPVSPPDDHETPALSKGHVPVQQNPEIYDIEEFSTVVQ